MYNIYFFQGFTLRRRRRRRRRRRCLRRRCLRRRRRCLRRRYTYHKHLSPLGDINQSIRS